ncbi:alpha/beta hydrolase-fold protein [Flavobacterium capsici]|uniref:Alpha/beta hydrolase-fold protein n=1 Tax=Flavobacterium capsici TaxID=3075618 RepID=A0AA96EWX6_9FLAO|nr:MULTISPECIES: alpha/beta hydrolase-fold protein [unclassified Flavobacterium]WNM18698.1 alpha/beta hydrolase-fold protein [Flavobacterium sp. PMR2A8]WNM22749.1 alpha/beta hydrolase-fold protein [Flavobacterium sp. PMTSA4]
MKKLHFSILLALLFIVNGFSQQIRAKYTAAVFNQPFTGNVLVYMSKENKEPKEGAVGLERFPCFMVSVKNIQPGQAVTIDDNAVSYPVTLSNIERGEYYVQIVWDRNLGGSSIAKSPGNLYNASQKINITKDTEKVFDITASMVIPELPAFKETKYVKEFKASSALLSNFHAKNMTVNAAVILPKEYYSEPKRKFPVLFNISGYGGDYYRYSGDTLASKPINDIAVIRVFLDGKCALGHSVYANSDNNGPWGDALVKEFIPQLEKDFRCNGAKLLTGHSSGGWSVLWLQTQYPKIFDGCWSSSPDPVDFRNFQKINLYEDKNMFYDKNGTPCLVATVAGFFPWATMKTIYQMENVIYRGEQMHSFDAVFSKKGTNGLPESICDSETGDINKTVFSNWKKYDIALNLKENWESVKSDLDGKVRISVGNQDNFLLNYAVRLLDEQMKQLHSSFQVAYYTGDHFTVFSPEYRKDGDDFLKQRYLDWLAKSNTLKN